MDSMLVLTGVSNRSDLESVPAQLRPTYVADDLSGLLNGSEISDR